MQYAVIGAAGIQARGIVLDLLEYGSADVILLADMAQESLDRRVTELDADPRLRTAVIDLTDIAATVTALAGTDVLVMAGPSPMGKYALEIALGLGCAYLDMGGAFTDTQVQLGFSERFEEAGLTGLLGIGSAPGMSNLMALAGADRLDRVHDIEMTIAMTDLTVRSSPFHWPFNLAAILDEYHSPAVAIRDGERVLIPPRTGEWVEFPAPIGRVRPIYTTHPEPESLFLSLGDRGVRNVSFRIAMPAEFDRKMDFLAAIGMASTDPVTVGGVSVSPADVLVEVTKGIPRGGEKEEQYSATQVLVRGVRDGAVREVELYMVTGSHERWNVPAGMLKTVVPPAIVAEMLGTGEIVKPGVWLPEQGVPTARFFSELARRGMPVTVAEREYLQQA